MKQFTPFILLLVLCVLMAIGLRAEKKGQPPSPMVGRTLPTLALEPVPLAANGRPMLLNVFASWCVPCLAELPELKKLREKTGIQVVGLAWKNDPLDVQEWFNKHGNPYSEIYFDQGGISTLPLSLTGVPETMIVNDKGVILYHTKQPLTAGLIRKEIMPIVGNLKP